MDSIIGSNRIDRTDGKEIVSKLFLFLIWPFATWLYCIKYPKSRSSYLIFFLFSLLLCWHMSPYMTSSYDDFLGILERFESFDLSDAELYINLEDYFSFKESAPKEIYEIILSYFTKLFTDNYHFYFLLAAIPVALCQLKSMTFITSDPRFINGSWVGMWLIIMFIFPRDIITVQNPRFATGFWLCIVGTICYFMDNKNLIWLLLVLIAPTCHSGLIIYTCLFVLYLVLPKKLRFFEFCALCSIPFAFFDNNIMSLIDVDLLPKNFQHWASIYLSDEAVAKYVTKTDRAGFWWIQAFFEILMKCTYFLMTYQLIRYYRNANISNSNKFIYSFYLFLFSFVNLIQFVPETGSRYFWFVRVLSLLVWFKAFGFRMKKTLYLLVFSCSFLMLMRYGYFMGGALSVTTNPDIFFMPLPYLLGKGVFWDLI